MRDDTNIKVAVLRDVYRVDIDGCQPKYVKPSSGRPTQAGAMAAARWAYRQHRKRNPLTSKEQTGLLREARRVGEHARRAWGHEPLEAAYFAGERDMEAMLAAQLGPRGKKAQAARIVGRLADQRTPRFKDLRVGPQSVSGKVGPGWDLTRTRRNPRRRNSQDDDLRALERAAAQGDPGARERLARATTRSGGERLVGRRIQIGGRDGWMLVTEGRAMGKGNTLWKPGLKTGVVVSVEPGRFYQTQENVSWLTVKLDRAQGRFKVAKAYYDERTGELMFGALFLGPTVKGVPSVDLPSEGTRSNPRRQNAPKLPKPAAEDHVRITAVR